ncbi:hypothetical protein DM860_002350 [Cuscuta australis]|uniref:HMA domain-containing protein n=1 Tax=Cuscuta australis TaxID=267555 RepID=A0A328CY47_9ASTE|nr:hypothetical protein DM860_002350 [Cuscuta australis]
MEQESCDHVCVLKVDVNCCSGCRTKLKKTLLKRPDVFSVKYDSITKWATVRCNCEPSVLVESIKKMGKLAKVVDPAQFHASAGDNNKSDDNNNGSKCCDSKGKSRENESPACSGGDDGCFKRSGGSKKEKHACAPLPPVDESICRDQFCRLHRRPGNGLDGSLFWNQSGPIGPGFGVPPQPYPPPPSYGYYGHPGVMPPPQPPGYGLYPAAIQMGMPGARLEFPFCSMYDQNPTHGCNTQ